MPHNNLAALNFRNLTLFKCSPSEPLRISPVCFGVSHHVARAIHTYDLNGYLIAVDGPLPGTGDRVTATYDVYDRTLTSADTSGYTLIFERDVFRRSSPSTGRIRRT